MDTPMKEHMAAVNRVLRFFKKTPCRELSFKKTFNHGIEVFTSADWVGFIVNRSSSSSYCSFIWGNLVTWRSRKQLALARSTVEAELRLLAHGLCEVLWLKNLLGELRILTQRRMKIFKTIKKQLTLVITLFIMIE